MATCTHGIQTGSTANATSYAAAAFTPSLNDLLVCMVAATGTVDAGTVTSTGNTAAWTKITSATFTAGANTCYLFVQNALCSNTSTTVTFNCAGDAGTGAVVAVVRVSGMTRTGSSAVKQSAVLNNVSTSVAVSSPTFASSCLTGNPTIEFAGNGNGDTYQPPTNWTEGAADTTYITPSTGFEYHFRNSGFTGTNIGWADTVGFSPTLLGIIAAELDTSAASGDGGVTAPAGALVLEGIAPAVSGSGNVTAPSGALLLGGTAPTINVGTSVVAPAGALTLAGTAPSLTVSSNITAPAGLLTLAGVAPGVLFDNRLTAPAGALVLTGIPPTVDGGSAPASIDNPAANGWIPYYL